jgi:pimeloyl-ACP methyl ester carboxylesterase
MIERVFEFGENNALVGTLASPVTTATQTTPAQTMAVLTFNAGIIPRTGPHRLWVKLARRLAAQGFGSMRFDLSGQGDSTAATSTLDFETQAVTDIRHAMSLVQAETGIKRFALVGICSGAALSYKAALADPRVVACAMIDIYMYPTWRTRWIRILARLRRDGIIGELRSRWSASGTTAGSPDSLPGLPAQSALPGLVKPTPDDFASGLQQLLSRGAQLYFIYTGSFLYSYNYREQFNDRFKRYRLKGRINVEFDPHIDHTVTEQRAQVYVIEKLTRWIQSIPGTG